MVDWIQKNPYALIAVFVAVSLIFVIAFVVNNAKTKKRKKVLLQENAGLAEIVFDCPLVAPSPLGGPLGNPASTVYVLYAVNGQPPRTFGYSILTTPGPVTLDYEYFLRQVGRKRFAKSFGRSNHTMVVSAGKKYMVSFNHMDNKLEHKDVGLL
ncbi:MAG: hypothetical protein LBJ44_07935 [Propionibacteriaceae bacterium]|jgi:hypothetical protein|nr:hypothetical protein [Propionibacteriaceae bacterium]